MQHNRTTDGRPSRAHRLAAEIGRMSLKYAELAAKGVKLKDDEGLPLTCRLAHNACAAVDCSPLPVSAATRGGSTDRRHYMCVRPRC